MAWTVLILGVVILAKLVNNISRLVRAGGRVTQEEKKLADTQALNRQLKERLSEVQTPQYMERQAREKLGYGKPGEVILVLPEQNGTQSSVLSTQEDKSENWVRWRKLYLGF